MKKEAGKPLPLSFKNRLYFGTLLIRAESEAPGVEINRPIS
jgi:hypothetical protein